MQNRLIIAGIASLAVGCGGAEPTPATPPPAEAPSPAPSAAPVAAPAQPAEPDPERVAPIPPLTPAEQTEFKAKCAPLVKAVEKAAEKTSGPAVFRVADVLKEVAASPIPGLKDDARARCTALFEQDSKVYLIQTTRVGAIGNLGVIVHLIDQAVARNGKACPDAGPVPRSFATLQKGVYTPSDADYADAGWKCLENAGIMDKLLAQLRVKSDDAGKTVTISARTMPFRDGKMVEYTRVGHVDSGSVKWDPPVTR